MQLLIDGRETPPERVCVNYGLNFGRFDGVRNQNIFRYEMIFTRDEFLSDFSEQYDALTSEMRQLDAEDGDPSEFAEIDYGPLSVLLDHPKLLFEIVDYYCAREIIFPKALPEREDEVWTFVINSVNRVVANDVVLISGQCWRR